jgi:hypothetical protein
MAEQPLEVQGLLITEASRSQTHHTRYDASGRTFSPTQTPLPDNTQHSQEKHPALSRIRTGNHSKRAAADPCLR